MNEFNFSNFYYKNKAFNSQTLKESEHTFSDAFLVLIKDVKFDDLSNLCYMIKDYYNSLSNPIELSVEDCYKLTQSDNLSDIEAQIIVDLAQKCIKNGNHLGSKTINDGKINTSSWISHSFYSSEVCGTLATKLGLDENTAKIVGLLHDYGRKFDHTFSHTLKGFEALTDIGWDNEALGCLTHSFVNGGRCSNNEQAIDGFYVDENGNAKWQEGTEKDDITLFLENYEYDEYDMILNIADLMATDKGIVSPYERIADIATRRIIDPTNRAYFLAELTNMLINFLNKINCNDSNFKFIKATKDISLEEIDNYFKKVSDHFFNVYLQLEQNYKYNNQNKK
jgi:hypothetical protein